jgi:hypothetical protein
MGNKLNKFLYLLLLVVIVAAGFFFGRDKISFLKRSVSVDSTGNTSLKIRQDLYEGVSNPKTDNDNISTSDPNFGRDNPFVPYK